MCVCVCVCKSRPGFFVKKDVRNFCKIKENPCLKYKIFHMFCINATVFVLWSLHKDIVKQATKQVLNFSTCLSISLYLSLSFTFNL